MQSIKHTLLGAATLASVLIFNPVAHAAGKHGNVGHNANRPAHFRDHAKVTHAEPIYRRVAVQQPTQECWYENEQHTTDYYRNKDKRPRHKNTNTAGQTIVGGLVGGVIGNQLGRRSGSRDARIGATVAGAIFGSVLANEGHSSRRRNRHKRPQNSHSVTESRPVKHCNTAYNEHYKRELIGYNVTYQYRGRSHTTHMQNDPGHRIPIQVSIKPVGH